ncbi:MAG: DUF1553 domain-containing protein [Planctomycetia bacterium]|nr:DUF1553 domain-containing protein [Planctomycetia bacterium]
MFGLFLATTTVSANAAAPAAPEAKISFHKQIRPIFQAQCQGCHQPAKQGGAYDMTTFGKLLKGGESETLAVVVGKPDSSNLVTLITPAQGKAEMPKGKEALSATDIDLIRKWIAQGALDDTPANTVQKYDAEHPPIYTRAPVIPSIDYSPDGKLLAVAGFHEVLLQKADGSGLVGRLVGVAERIEKVKFSPDGTKLAVSGGLPARVGEIQVWDVATKKLLLSTSLSFDSLYGVSWSPDGKSIACGCGDNSVRVVDAATGKQTLYMGSHNDWALDTVFSTDGSHLVSVSRDRSAKLVEVDTQRFVDNITSITPGALKGGLQAVARHPSRDEIVFGGADGVPKIYRIYRVSKRVIGDDANLVSVLPALKGRVFGVDFSRDGKLIAASSSNDGVGEIGIYQYADDAALAPPLKKILEKKASDRSEAETKQLDDISKSAIKQLAKVEVATGGVFAVAFAPDGKTLAAAGFDGSIRLLNTTDGKLVKQFVAVPLAKADVVKSGVKSAAPILPPAVSPTETLPPAAVITALEISPSSLELTDKFDYAQLVVTAKLEGGAVLDVTRMAKLTASSLSVELIAGGVVVARTDGTSTITATIAGKTAGVPVKVVGTAADFRADYIRDVNPVLSRMGCNQGTCHGAKDGKNGFKLSLRGYDPVYDLRAFTDDHASRRVNVAAADNSLMLLKATGSVAHVGGQLTKPGEAYYELVRQWIADGAKVDFKTPRVVGIEVLPKSPVIDRAGQNQQMRVIARYADGKLRDVTREAFIESGNIEVVSAATGGLLTALRRGEAPVLARYEGSYAAATLTVMGDRTGYQWVEPAKNNKIDELTSAKWKRMKIVPSDICNDADFMRRVSIDLTGLPPTAEDVNAFLADTRATQIKRDALVDKLIGSETFVDHWTNKWADLLQVNPKFLGNDGAKQLRDWIRKEVAANTPYDQFVKKILTAGGSNRENPAAAYYKILRDPADTMENTTHLFLAVRFNCNKCHDHPFERWTQDQYYQTAAFFSQIDLQADPMAKGAVLGATAVEKGKPLYEIVADKTAGEMTHERTGQVVPPQFPFPAKFTAADKASRREKLAAWITSADNQYFAKSYVNRVWGYLFGVGIMEPIDDIRAGNPPSNPELLDFLTQEFLKNKFDARELMRTICKSRTYQLSIATNKWNSDDKINYSHASARRLPAEVLYDAIHTVTGSQTQFAGYPAGTRAANLPEVNAALGAGFLQTFGRPPRESACECERQGGMALGPVMAMISGPTLSNAVDDPKNALASLVAKEKDDGKVVDGLFLRVLNRHATKDEVALATKSMQEIEVDHAAMTKRLSEREAWWKPIAAKLEQERLAAIAAAKKELETYEKAQAPIIAAAEKARLDATAKAALELQTLARRLPRSQEAWEKALAPTADSPTWHPLKITAATAQASSPVALKIENDTTVFTVDRNAQPTYKLTGETSLANVTGIMLEVLPDERLPNFGPGFSNRNFVLTEIVVSDSNPLGTKTKKTVLEPSLFNDALADVSQDKFDVKTAIDGKKDQGAPNGWASGGKPGAHRAVFQLTKPIAYAPGAELKIDLLQVFQQSFGIGKFRIWVTDAKKPLGFGLPVEIAAIVKTPAEKRTLAQWDALDAYQRFTDANYDKQETVLWTARLPLPIDQQLVALKTKVTTAETPIMIDPPLVQLRADHAMSAKQNADKRLTVVQDLAWALMNSPAFLFNH